QTSDTSGGFERWVLRGRATSYFACYPWKSTADGCWIHCCRIYSRNVWCSIRSH
ncbi:hypothetical protein MKW94_025949, partial [Papaver nudicaule]|nr:hypothetical protein [Papaver nudicaule]